MKALPITVIALLIWPVSSTVTPSKGYRCLRVRTKDQPPALIIAKRVEKYHLTGKLDVFTYRRERKIELTEYSAIADSNDCGCSYFSGVCTDS